MSPCSKILLSSLPALLLACTGEAPESASSEPPPATTERASATEPPPPHVGPPPQATPASEKTVVHDRAELEKLLGNSGITLHWIDWDHRGEVNARWEGEMLHLSGEQRAQDGSDRFVRLSGKVTEIGRDYFYLDGTLEIENSPDMGRSCKLDDVMEFRVTQNRKYWRFRRFEWCDYLTDYIDIYF